MDTPASEAVNARLSQLLEFLDTGLREGKEFVVAQAPEVAREMLAWGFWSSLCQIAVCALIWVITAIAVPRLIRRCAVESKKGFMEENPLFVVGPIVLSGVMLMGSMIAFPVAYDAAQTALKTVIAPRLYIIDRLK